MSKSKNEARRTPPLTGLIAAAYTPLDRGGELNLHVIKPLVDNLLAAGVSGLYVCGSTGEGMSLTAAERQAVAEAHLRAAAGRVPVIVQVGHNCLKQAADLAAHAQSVGATAISATAPNYFKPGSVDELIAAMAQVARAAPRLPFYYYHIPSLTGVDLPMPVFLERAACRIDNLRGIKFSSSLVHEFQLCRSVSGACFDMLWGVDEMLLSAWAAGARGAVGSTYNFMTPLYRRMLDAFEAGRLADAQALQAEAAAVIQTLLEFPYHPAVKRVLRWQGLDCGGCRLPLPALSPAQTSRLRRRLQAMRLF